MGTQGLVTLIDGKEVIMKYDKKYRLIKDSMWDLYVSTFDLKDFNLRWERGTADYVEIVELNSKLEDEEMKDDDKKNETLPDEGIKAVISMSNENLKCFVYFCTELEKLNTYDRTCVIKALMGFYGLY